MDDLPFVSVIIPARNEEKLIGSCLKSLRSLNYPKDKVEIIVSDALSIDQTRKIAESFGAKVVNNKKLRVASGRNIGFSFSGGKLIVFTDADCVFDKEWLNNAVKYFKEENIAGAGGPSLSPGEEGSFAKAVEYLFLWGSFASGSVQSSGLKKVKQVKSIPGCNSIYKRSALEKVMPVDENLITCDDTEMNYRLTEKGYKLLYVPDLIVWHRRRDNFKKFFRQIFRYAQGRVQLRRRHKSSLRLIHILFGFSIPVMIVLLLFNFSYFLFLTALISAAALVFSLFVLIKEKSLQVFLWAFFVCWIFILAWSLGFLKELFLSFDKKNADNSQ
jgi:cellulose synthase/poly-beta-1,6-N-acetylglucosamine synthase-like glycosyltransferase